MTTRVRAYISEASERANIFLFPGMNKIHRENLKSGAPKGLVSNCQAVSVIDFYGKKIVKFLTVVTSISRSKTFLHLGTIGLKIFLYLQFLYDQTDRLWIKAMSSLVLGVLC